jgi:hypothetical protein
VCYFVALIQVKDEKGILSNRYGSVRYTEFIQGLGNIVRLPEPKQQATSYIGTLSSEDGKFTYTWQDESMMGQYGMYTTSFETVKNLLGVEETFYMYKHSCCCFNLWWLSSTCRL